MFKRVLTLTEKILIGVLAFVVIVACYVKFVQIPINNEIAQNELLIPELELTAQVEGSKFVRVNDMKNKTKEAKESGALRLPEYDNSTSVIYYLNGMLKSTDDISITFRPVEIDGALAVRPVDISFTCGTYNYAQNLILELNKSPYVAKVVETSMNIADYVSCNITVLFFECVSESN